MRRKIAIFIACLILPLSAVRADSDSVCKVGDAEIADKELCIETGGCQYLDGRCEKCKDGTYGEYGLCVPCKDDWPHSHLLDDYGHIYLGDSAPTGATKPEHCYQECKEDGVRIPGKDNAFKVKTSDVSYFPDACKYTLGCDVGTTTVNGTEVTNVCNSYFAYPSTNIDNGSCQPRWTTTRPPETEIGIDCNKGATTKYYLRNDAGKFDCYANGCEDSDVYEFVITDTATNGGFVCYLEGQLKNLGQCMRKNIPCKEILEISQACDGWQQDAELNDGDAIYNKETGEYDYHGCKCTTNDKYPIPIISANNEQIGKQKVQCSYDTVTGFNNETCTTVQVVECIERYCVPVTNPPTTTCVPTLAGYYSTDRSTTCDECPAGTTSSGKNAGKNECGIKLGTDGTKFCDKSGSCFTLPGSGFVGQTN